MRVISGCYRGRRLKTPPGLETRPIADRVKASLFDWLGSRLGSPGRLPPICVCDLFSGAGSQGIEALSRGAVFCAFVEIDREALTCLRDNLHVIGIEASAAVIAHRAESVTISPPGDGRFSLIFLDPPYRLSEDVSPQSIMGRVVGRLGTHIPIEPDALVLWRHADTCTLPAVLPGGWKSTERRSWGGMAITLFERPDEVNP